MTIGINGRWRYITANADCAAPGGLIVGDNPVFVTANDNVFTPNPDPTQPEFDTTNYNFFLLVLTAGATPSGTGSQTLWRQVGWATWDGTKFTDVRLIIGSGANKPAKHEATHEAGGSDALPWTTINGYGTLSGRPGAAASNAGYSYYATDTTTSYRSNGTTWDTETVAKRYAANVGDGASTSIAVTHNLGTQDVIVQVHAAASTFDVVVPNIQITDVNTVTLIFGTAPALNAYRVVVLA